MNQMKMMMIVCKNASQKHITLNLKLNKICKILITVHVQKIQIIVNLLITFAYVKKNITWMKIINHHLVHNKTPKVVYLNLIPMKKVIDWI